MSAEPFFRSRWVEEPDGVEQLDGLLDDRHRLGAGLRDDLVGPEEEAVGVDAPVELWLLDRIARSDEFADQPAEHEPEADQERIPDQQVVDE